MSGMFGEVTVTGRKSVEWYTPEWVFDLLGLKFDLDPCSPFDFQTVVPAARKLTVFDDGLKSDWCGRVWLNPPYNRSTALWMERLIAHGNGIALVFSRTDAKWFQRSLNAATAVLFVEGRIQFIPGIENQHKKSRCGAGTALLAFGYENAKALKNLAPDKGRFFWCQEAGR